MTISRLTYSAIVTTIIFCSCVKPFSPSVTTVNANILVVEGFINTGGDTTKIKLSRTVTIGNKNSSVPETGDIVTVENAAGVSFAVPETKVKGSYASNGALALTSGTQYRIRIKTSGGQTYLSDLVDSKVAPPIDSIGYTFEGNFIRFYVNAHDPANKTLYYQYGFSETWEFHAYYVSNYVSNGKNAGIQRTAANMVYYCFAADSNVNILINSTAALGKDVVYQFPINSIIDTTEKLGLRYSILVSQQALTQQGYTFWQNMKSNTEQLGSIFDAQPSTISGNIHNIANASEPVIGFISAGTVQKKRIYINKNTLPANFVAGYPFNCNAPGIPGTAIDVDSLVGPTNSTPWAWPTVIQLPSKFRILDEMTPQGPFTFATAGCSDCTIRGTNTPPAFWKP